MTFVYLWSCHSILKSLKALSLVQYEFYGHFLVSPSQWAWITITSILERQTRRRKVCGGGATTTNSFQWAFPFGTPMNPTTESPGTAPSCTPDTTIGGQTSSAIKLTHPSALGMVRPRIWTEEAIYSLIALNCTLPFLLSLILTLSNPYFISIL